MRAVMYDYFRADVYANEFIKKDSTRKLFDEHTIMVAKILKQHRITPSQFEESYNYYINHPEKFATLLDSILADQARKPIFDIKNLQPIKLKNEQGM